MSKYNDRVVAYMQKHNVDRLTAKRSVNKEMLKNRELEYDFIPHKTSRKRKTHERSMTEDFKEYAKKNKIW